MATQTSITSGILARKQPLVLQLFQFLVIGLLVLLLINYKGKAGFSKIQHTQATGSIALPALLVENKQGQASAFSDAVAYLKIVWPALLFGVLISAAVRTSLSRTPLCAVFGRGSVRDQLTGAAAGAPLMLCSCCVAPIFPAVYERTHKLAPALALTLAAPSLNPVALTLTFILFPWRIAGARLIMALILVLIGSAVVAKIARRPRVTSHRVEEQPAATWLSLLASYGNSLAYVAVRTVPLVLVGIWASMWVMRRLPLSLSSIATSGAHITAIAIIATIALLLTLPSLFEIPLALSILAAGGPVGGAAAVLFAGPAINIPSLLVIGRHSSWKLAVALAMLVWAIAAIGGFLLH